MEIENYLSVWLGFGFYIHEKVHLGQPSTFKPVHYCRNYFIKFRTDWTCLHFAFKYWHKEGKFFKKRMVVFFQTTYY